MGDGTFVATSDAVGVTDGRSFVATGKIVDVVVVSATLLVSDWVVAEPMLGQSSIG